MSGPKQYGGHSMVARLQRVAVCSPESAGWNDGARTSQWKELGYLRRPDFREAQRQHQALRRVLEAGGAQVLEVVPNGEPSLDAVFVHDPSLVSDHGAVVLRMGKRSRESEPAAHRVFYQSAGIPVLGELKAPATAEAGDLVWLDEKTLLAGRGYRTNSAGIEQLRHLLGPKGIEVVAAPLPHGRGPSYCLHLMSLMSLLGERTVLVDLEWLAVETVEALERRGFQWIEIEAAERETLACNVLALGPRDLLAFAENPKTNERLRRAGFKVEEIPGSEVGINGGGGLTCLTRPLLRG